MSRRTNSGSKWKEVLGFDDGSSTSSSTGSQSPAASIYTPQPVQAPSHESKRPSYPRFPRDITFFRSKGDILLSPSSPAPSPNDVKPLPAPPHLFHITVQKDPLSSTVTARPDIILHSGPSKAATIICYAKFHAVTTSTEMTLCPPAPEPISTNFSTVDFASTKSSSSSTSSWAERESERPQFQVEKLQSSGGIFTTEKYGFSHTHPRTHMRDRFEWRNSSRSFIRSFDEDDQDTGGLKLIRARTGDVIAVYAGLGRTSQAKNPSRVVGMFRFLMGDSQGLGEEFEVLAVVSLLSIVERARRSMRAHQLAFG